MKSISLFIRRHFGFYYYGSFISRFKGHPLFRRYRSVRLCINFSRIGFYIEKAWNNIDIHILFFTISLSPNARITTEDYEKIKACRSAFLQVIEDTEEAAKIGFESITANFTGLYKGTKFHLAPMDPGTCKAISIKDLYVMGTEYSSEESSARVGATVFLGIEFDEGPARETIHDLIRQQKELDEYKERLHI